MNYNRWYGIIIPHLSEIGAVLPPISDASFVTLLLLQVFGRMVVLTKIHFGNAVM